MLYYNYTKIASKKNLESILIKKICYLRKIKIYFNIKKQKSKSIIMKKKT